MVTNQITTLSEKQIGEINRYIERIKSDKTFNVQQVILFGSYAKGTPHKWSDIDLAIISDKFENDRFDYLVALSKQTIGISNDIEPYPLSPEDLNDRFHTLAQEVVKYGIVVG